MESSKNNLETNHSKASLRNNGSGKPTIDDIARVAKVSKSTVSRVLNGTAPVGDRRRKAINDAMEQLNYRPNQFARGLAGGRSMTIGIVTQHIGSPIYDWTVNGVVKGLDQTDYTAVIVDGCWDTQIEAQVIETLLDRQVDGLIILGGSQTAEFLNEVDQKTPVLMVGRTLSGWEDRSIYIDNFQAAVEATEFLIELGHRKIAHIRGPAGREDAELRLKGFQSVMTKQKFSKNKQMVYQGDYTAESGIEAIRHWLDQSIELTAIFAANDQMAMGAILELSRKGIKIPNKVSVIGLDDQPDSRFIFPPLTTIAVPAAKMGMAAAKAILCRLQNKPAVTGPIATELMVRESTARI